MATIRQLPSGKLNAQIRIKGSANRSQSFPTLDDARRWVEAQTPTKTQAAQAAVTFRDLALRYCSSQLMGRPSRHMMLAKMERVAEFFPQPFTSITRSDVNAFRLARMTQVSGPTVREDLQIINKLFRWAGREMVLGNGSLVHRPKTLPCRHPVSRVRGSSRRRSFSG